MSGTMTRACDCCLRKRARWYCLADDAFLCQNCDGSVHSANPFAQRHDRVRLMTGSLKANRPRPNFPSWHHGSTRKARTPRKSGLPRTCLYPNRLYAVPDIGADETTSSHDDETEDKLIHLVPTFDPFGAELCSSTSTSSGPTVEVEGSGAVISHMMGSPQDEYLSSDLYLDEFAADVETLLGRGLDDGSYGIDELGLLNCSNNEKDDNNPINLLKAVKAEENDLGTINNNEDEMVGADVEIKEPFDFSFDHQIEDQEDQKLGFYKALMGSEAGDHSNDLGEEEREKEEGMKRRKILLRLDYEAIIEAWASQGSPWINGQRPEINLDDCWPPFMGNCRAQITHYPLNIDQEMGGNGVFGDGGREARVSRYREKRRTRLFAKKIRYEVRKLNAEKRPRMKGRFVKRSSFASAASTPNSVCI